MEIHLDGVIRELKEGATLRDLLPEKPPECSVAIIKSSDTESEVTSGIRLTTTSGEVVIELISEKLPEEVRALLSGRDELRLKWADRQSASFGPFSTGIRPAREPHRYERGDLILGCGGYDPGNSYLIFSRMRHSSDHGAGADGGVIAKVVSGHGVIDRWKTGDAVLTAERVISRADKSNAVLTKDPGFLLEDGMQIISHVRVVAAGYADENIDTVAADSVEHMLISLKSGLFRVSRATSTHIRDERLRGSDVLPEKRGARLEGTVTVRTKGRSKGSVYIYTQDIAPSPNHTVTGTVEHGIELIKLASDEDIFSIEARPSQFDLRGLSLSDAIGMAENRSITLNADSHEGSRVVILQDPANTLEVLAAGEVNISTVPVEQVITIKLDDTSAPRTCATFRTITGLRWHSLGEMPFFFNFEDVFLFKPHIPKGISINSENVPEKEVQADALAMTNDSRKGSGLVGVRRSSNQEFGPTSEPFGATNIIGEIIDSEKLTGLKEGETVYIREARI